MLLKLQFAHSKIPHPSTEASELALLLVAIPSARSGGGGWSCASRGTQCGTVNKSVSEEDQQTTCLPLWVRVKASIRPPSILLVGSRVPGGLSVRGFPEGFPAGASGGFPAGIPERKDPVRD